MILQPILIYNQLKNLSFVAKLLLYQKCAKYTGFTLLESTRTRNGKRWHPFVL